MCGIVGFTGHQSAKDVLIEGLKRLEYRGYDSAGIALQNTTNEELTVVHRVGKVAGLAEAVEYLNNASPCGIGHTRWATHGAPSERNAHPHTSCDNQIAVVHNGIIENFAELREQLEARGHKFRSDTDTEVVSHLIEEAYRGNLRDAVAKACSQIVGTYGLAVICSQEPGRIVVTRKDSPIVLAHGEKGSYVASDIIAVIEASRDVTVLGDNEFAVMEPDGISYTDADGNPIQPKVMHVDWDVDVVEKGGYPDFMLKEIHEQPRVIRDTLAGRLTNGVLSIDELGMSLEQLRLIDRVYIIACGTSYHAGLIARQLIEGWARIPVEVEAASEFRYRNPIITPSTLVVAVSQSGETADTLAAIRDARIKGAKVFGITNVIGSPVARESDGVIYTKANKEIAVASTKSFLGQIVSLTLLAMVLAQAKGKLSIAQIRLLFKELADTAEQVEEVLSDTKAIDIAAQACKDANDALFIGRGYLHAEAYAAGEMKHGPIALLSKGYPVIAVATNSPVYDKMISNIQESRARGAMIIAVATEGDQEIKKHADYVIYVPKVRDAFSPIIASVPFQLFARSVALARGCDVDKPRNLAKSVTVE